jgi:hypothetical protein
MLSLSPHHVDQPAFASPAEHLHTLLGWLDRVLAWHIAVTRHTYGAVADDAYRGLYISDAEADMLSTSPPLLSNDLAVQHVALTTERAEIDARAHRTTQQGMVLPCVAVGHVFGLNRTEQDVLLLALAPEVDLRYERLFAYIQDDVTKKRPSVELALRLLCVALADRLDARRMFAPHAPLLRHHLIQLFDDGQRQPPLLARFLKLDERIVTELLGQPAIDPSLAGSVTLMHPQRQLTDLVLPQQFVVQLRRMSAAHDDGFVLALQGSYGSGRGAVAEAVCAELGMPLLKIDLQQLVASDMEPVACVERVLREALLRGAAILWQGADRLLFDDALVSWRTPWLALLDQYTGCSFLAVEQHWEAHGALRRRYFLCVELPMPSFAERDHLWRLQLNGDAPDAATMEALTSTFRLSGGQIRDAVVMARSLARWRGGPITSEDFYVACRAQSSGKLHSLAHKIVTTYSWNDIVLPVDQLDMLREICVQVRHRRQVLERWGFDQHLAMGKGLNVLFAGPSGTGKTMAADIIASNLGLELYKVDLSTVVSKYIGETEKNLERIFTAAREANAILFFDEADALFGKRSEVKDAHDRYANIEVGYLLQQMEAYDGVVILATNLRKNMDDAFVRRLHVAIDFPFPEEADRLRIWQKVFPREAPLADDVDLQFVAKQFKLSGGNIRNIALLAAYLAAEQGTPIGMRHLVRAIKREYQKLGKLVTEAEFGVYLRFVRE